MEVMDGLLFIYILNNRKLRMNWLWDDDPQRHCAEIILANSKSPNGSIRTRVFGSRHRHF